jgi:hypothetical protein
MFLPVVAAAVAAAVLPQSLEALVGTWDGGLTGPDGSVMTVGLRFTRDAEGRITAVADSPDGPSQTVRDLAISGGVVTFSIEGVVGRAELRLSGDSLSGVWKGDYGDLPLRLTRQPAG